MTTNIAESFNSWLREECHQTIYTLLLMHVDKLVEMLTNHISHIKRDALAEYYEVWTDICYALHQRYI